MNAQRWLTNSQPHSNVEVMHDFFKYICASADFRNGFCRVPERLLQSSGTVAAEFRNGKKKIRNGTCRISRKVPVHLAQSSGTVKKRSGTVPVGFHAKSRYTSRRVPER